MSAERNATLNVSGERDIIKCWLIWDSAEEREKAQIRIRKVNTRIPGVGAREAISHCHF